MATYEYQYTRSDGTSIRVERINVPMSKASESVEVVDEVDGKRYIAKRIMSITANMGHSWSEDVRTSDLPPKHYGPEDVKRDKERRKGRKLSTKT